MAILLNLVRGFGTYGRLVVTHLDWQFSEPFRVDQACNVHMVFTVTTSGSIAATISTHSVIYIKIFPVSICTH